MPQNWPPDLDFCFLYRGFSESKYPVTIRSEVDSGPAKVRRRYTKAARLLNGGMVFEVGDVSKFWTFFDVTLKNGSLTFNENDPITNAPSEFRFYDVPVVNMMTEKYVSISFTLEAI